MTDWIVEIETAAEAATDADALERFALALDAHELTATTAAGINSRTGVISATFTLTAPDPVGAVERCVAAFRAALAASDLEARDPARVVVELIPAWEALVA